MAHIQPITPPLGRPLNVFERPLEDLTPEELQHRRNILETRKMERENNERETADNQSTVLRYSVTRRRKRQSAFPGIYIRICRWWVDLTNFEKVGKYF